MAEFPPPQEIKKSSASNMSDPHALERRMPGPLDILAAPPPHLGWPRLQGSTKWTEMARPWLGWNEEGPTRMPLTKHSHNQTSRRSELVIMVLIEVSNIFDRNWIRRKDRGRVNWLVSGRIKCRQIRTLI